MKNILLVEDEAILAMMTKNQLKKVGYEVTTVPSGDRAIDVVNKQNLPIDLILMDIDLGPGLDGTETAREILKTNDIPILFLSSHTEQEIVSRTEQITNYGYVVKNSNFTVLDASIKMAFKLFEAYRDIHNQKMEIEASYEEMQVANENLIESENRLMKSEAAVRNKLKSILDPSGDIGVLELEDIIDTEAIQNLMEDFFALTGMLGAILDIKGKVLVAVGWQDICTKFHRCHPESAMNCLESDTILTRDVADGTYLKYRCKNNMWDMVTPLVIDGKHLGNIFIGQFFMDDEVLDVELFRAQARKYGFDESEYLSALSRVPRFSPETVDRGMTFYAKIAKLISSLSYSSIKLSRSVTERKLAEQNVEKLLAEKELILKEVHHRIKNNMSMVHGLLVLQSSEQSNPEIEAILGDAASRVQSMMVLYEKLYLSDDTQGVLLGSYLSALAEELIAVFPQRQQVRFETNIEDLYLKSSYLSTLGIILNELITNSMKYAFVGRNEGLIELRIRSEGARIVMKYGDDGVGLPTSGDFERLDGFGIQLIKALVEQLEGTIRLLPGSGAHFVIEFTPRK